MPYSEIVKNKFSHLNTHNNKLIKKINTTTVTNKPPIVNNLKTIDRENKTFYTNKKLNPIQLNFKCDRIEKLKLFYPTFIINLC